MGLVQSLSSSRGCRTLLVEHDLPQIFCELLQPPDPSHHSILCSIRQVAKALIAGPLSSHRGGQGFRSPQLHMSFRRSAA
jgi:hypothetical protein